MLNFGHEKIPKQHRISGDMQVKLSPMSQTH